MGQAVGAALAILAALGLAFAKGRSTARNTAERDKLEKEVKAHDRINDAETGVGATDAERIKRLRKRGGGDWSGD